MKLIFLYGPPGSGKLTVATELSKLTGYGLFHNHLTVDLAHSIFPFGTKEYSALVQKIRLDLFEAAGKAKINGMIFTFVYGVETLGGSTDDLLVKKIIRLVEKYHGQVLFVKLKCEQQELFKRIRRPSRKQYKKLKDVKVLKSILKKYKLDETIPFSHSLVIDNTSLSAQRAALLIQKHYRL